MKILGDISYPLYIIHEPLLRMIAGVKGLRHLVIGFPVVIPVLIGLLMSIAYLAFRYFDQPVRAAISARLKRIATQKQRANLEPAPSRA